jgi:hypothetical protein
LDGVVGGAEDPAPTLSFERLAKLGDGGHEQDQQEEVTHDPAHVRQAAPEDEERREPQAE